MEKANKEAEALLEKQAYSKRSMVILGVLLLIPGIINFLGLWWSKNGLSVSISLIMFGYSVPIALIRVLVDDSLNNKMFATDPINDPLEKNRVIKETTIGSAIILLVVAVVLIVYSIISSFGPEKIILPLPMYGGFLDVFYWIFFVLIWGLVLPVFEVYFFFGIQAYCWSMTNKNLFISAFYTWMNFGWIWFTIDGFFADLIITAIAFGVGVVLFSIRDRRSFFHCLGPRIAIGLALLVYCFALSMGHPKMFKTPTIYSRAAYEIKSLS